MIISIALLALGLFFLVLASDMLIEASVRLAEKLHISKLAISLTVVALGTSVPETVVSIMSALKGSSIALANVLGSNIANSALIMGVALFFGEIIISKNMRNESTKLSLITIIFVALCLIFKELNVITGVIMILVLLIYLYSLYQISKEDNELEEADESEEWIYTVGKKILRNENLVIFVFIVLGILGLMFGGNLVVDHAINIAKLLNINEGVIGASIVALGTSLPELMTSIMAMKKKQADIIFGNIVGSNVINILLILGVSSILTPLKVSSFEYLQIILLSVVTLVFHIFSKRKDKFMRHEGIILLILYFVSMVLIYVVK